MDVDRFAVQAALCRERLAMPDEPPASAPGIPVIRRQHTPERRTFLARLGLTLGGVAAAIVGLPVAGFLLAPARRHFENVWRPVGAAGDFAIGATVKVTYLDPEPMPWAGFVAENAAYVRREDEETFVAFSIYCTHTGCPVHWLEGARLFFCPCHAGVFYDNGAVAAGPPPRPLQRHEVRVRNGRIELRTHRLAAEEQPGAWGPCGGCGAAAAG
jgi:menaquinol-cytochrome c reductase iron-sulfur subunit